MRIILEKKMVAPGNISFSYILSWEQFGDFIKIIRKNPETIRKFVDKDRVLIKLRVDSEPPRRDYEIEEAAIWQRLFIIEELEEILNPAQIRERKTEPTSAVYEIYF